MYVVACTCTCVCGHCFACLLYLSYMLVFHVHESCRLIFVWRFVELRLIFVLIVIVCFLCAFIFWVCFLVITPPTQCFLISSHIPVPIYIDVTVDDDLGNFVLYSVNSALSITSFCILSQYQLIKIFIRIVLEIIIFFSIWIVSSFGLRRILCRISSASCIKS